MIIPREGVHTAPEPRARRLNRRLTGFDQILGAVPKDEALHLHYENGRPPWSLGGRSVAADVASFIIVNASVVPVGDALFFNVPGQSWRTQ